MRWYKNGLFIGIFVFVILIIAGGCFYYLSSNTVVKFQDIKVFLPQKYKECPYSENKVACVLNEGAIFLITARNLNIDISTREARSAELKNEIETLKIKDRGSYYNYQEFEFKGDTAFWVDSTPLNDPLLWNKSIYFIKNGKIYVVGFGGSKEFISESWSKMEKSILNAQFMD